MAVKDYSVYRGDTITLPISFVDGDGNAIDISGWTLFFTLKNAIDDTDDSAVLKVDVSGHVDAINGLTKIVLPDSDTDDLAGEYYYDIQYKDGSGNIRTIISGHFEFVKDVTRRTS